MKKTSQLSVLFFLWCLHLQISAQEANFWSQPPSLFLTGFTDTYYAYDFNQPEGSQRQTFLFNHNRHNEFNLNLGLIKLSIAHPKYRANFALQTGTYANDNYAAEPGVLKNIFEANVGIALNEKSNLWLDMGVLPSHIGFESAISIDNMTLTRSLPAENSPYFLAGAKLTFTPDDRWEFAALVVNGWQRIQRLEGNSLPSFGTQVIYNLSENISFNWSTFIGTDDPDETRRMRYFSNLYSQFQVSEKLGLIAGFDLGFQERTRSGSDTDVWFSPVIIGQYILSNTWKTAVRLEYYQDKTGIIIPTTSEDGFKTAGFSLNLDYAPNKIINWRIEGRWLNSSSDIFMNDSSSFTNNNVIIATSLAIRFDTKLTK
ncbi:porin [Flavobacteriaceae bacterium M23B6Z8]